MSEARKGGWGPFLIFFLGGWALFAYLIATNGTLATAASPNGILEHQTAGTAARVDEIQGAWAEAGTLGAAKLGMGIDLVFIGVLTIGGILGGLAVAQRARGPIVRALGWLAALGFLVFGAADYTETIAQFIQVNSRGDDALAGLAATANRPKVMAFLAAHATLIAGFAGYFLTRPKAA